MLMNMGMMNAQSLAPGNLVLNGTFDTDLSGWSYTAGRWEWESGKAKVIDVDGIFQDIGVVSGQDYTVEFEANGTGVIQIRLGSIHGAGIIGTTTDPSGLVSVTGTASTGGSSLNLYCSTFLGTIDNIVVIPV